MNDPAPSATAPPALRIDFVSDIACPWCAIGLASLEHALARVGDAVRVDLHFQPFELNPTMGPDGADAAQYLKNKYGLSDEQLAANRARLVALGAAQGVVFGARERVWNTFDAHRLLHWAGVEGAAGAQRALKRTLLAAYHRDGLNPSDPDVLLPRVRQVGLPHDRAREVLASGAFADDVRAAERHWQQAGIRSVPATVIDGRHLISGGQPPDVFEQALRRWAAARAAE